MPVPVLVPIISLFGIVGLVDLILLAKHLRLRGTVELLYKIKSTVPQTTSDLDAFSAEPVAVPWL